MKSKLSSKTWNFSKIVYVANSVTASCYWQSSDIRGDVDKLNFGHYCMNQHFLNDTNYAKVKASELAIGSMRDPVLKNWVESDRKRSLKSTSASTHSKHTHIYTNTHGGGSIFSQMS